MPTHEVIGHKDGLPTFRESLDLILRPLRLGGAIKTLTPLEAITDRQRRWYKGVCLPWLVKNDENGEGLAWWDDEVKRVCSGLALLKKEIFFMQSDSGQKIPIGRLTTKGVGVKNMTLFIEEILSKSMEKGWDIAPPDPELRKT